MFFVFLCIIIICCCLWLWALMISCSIHYYLLIYYCCYYYYYDLRASNDSSPMPWILRANNYQSAWRVLNIWLLRWLGKVLQVLSNEQVIASSPINPTKDFITFINHLAVHNRAYILILKYNLQSKYQRNDDTQWPT